MSPETKIKIIDVRKIPSADPNRVGKFDRLITYQIDTFRTYVITIPEEEFNEENLKARIQEELKEMEGWINKEITV